MASTIKALPWVADGIDEGERESVQGLVHLGTFHETAFGDLVDKPWVEDGLNEAEATVAQNVRWAAIGDEAAAVWILSMPFLEVVEPADASAVTALRRLVRLRPEDFESVMSHPTMQEGITDRWAKVVATLYGVSKTNSRLIGALLDPDRMTLEERTIDLPLAGEVDLAIIRTGPGAARSMDLLEHAVRHAEAFMGVPFPTGYVGYLFAEAVTPSFGGTNFGTHIASLPKYDVDDGSHEASVAGAHIAHEVAHYYWRGGRDWVDEGAADLMASIAENARTGQPVGITNDPCGYARTIEELEDLDPGQEDGRYSAFTCNYALGERLFVDLHRSLSEERFRRGFQELYRSLQVEDEDDAEPGAVVGMEHLRAAFEMGADIASPVVKVVTARWYEGSEAHDTSARDTRPVNPALPAVNGRIDQAYVSSFRGGTPGSSFSARAAKDWVWLFIDYDYAVSAAYGVELELVDYFEDGFVFDRRSVSFTAKPEYIGGSWWLRVGVSPSKRWATGRYWVYVYHEGQKVAEVEYEVVP